MNVRNQLFQIGDHQIRAQVCAARVILSQTQGSFITRKQGRLESNGPGRIDIVKHVIAEVVDGNRLNAFGLQFCHGHFKEDGGRFGHFVLVGVKQKPGIETQTFRI
jgi:hypothetical protein